MGRMSRCLIFGSCLIAWTGSCFAAPGQTISDPAQPHNLTFGVPPPNNGETHGVLFDTFLTGSSTLSIQPTINVNTTYPVNSSAIASATAFASLKFEGTSTVFGTVGIYNGSAAFPIAAITGGYDASTLTFNNEVNATQFTIAGLGTVVFLENSNAAMQFDGDGIMNLAAGKTFIGTITNSTANTGTLILNAGSKLDGPAATATNLRQITLTTGNASITGATGAQSISLGANTLAVATLSMPGGTGVINATFLSDTSHGQINVIGGGASTTIGTPLTVNASVQGQLTGARLTLVDGTGGSNGSIVNVISDNPNYSFTGVNTTGSVFLYPQYNFILPAAVPALAGPAAILSVLFPIAGNNPSSDLATVMNAITAIPSGATQQAALLQLNPIVDGALTQLSFTTAQLFQGLWQKQMGNGRCVMAASCGQDCSPNVPRTPEQQADCELRSEKGCYTKNNCKNVENQFEVWADGFGHWGHQEARQGYNSYNANIFGGMLGFQAPINQITSVGVAAGYANTQIHRKNRSSIQSWDGTAYLSVNPTNFYLDAAFSFDWNQYKDERHIQFTGINRTAHANYDGQQYTGLVAGGYRFYTDSCLTITPMASLQYSYLHVDSYNERDAGDISLRVQSQEYNFLESGLGLKLSRPFQSKWGAFVPEVHGLWYYDYFGDDMDITTTFSGIATQGGITKTDGPDRDKNWGDVGIGLTYYSCTKTSVEFVYNYEFSKTYHASEGLVKIAQRF